MHILIKYTETFIQKIDHILGHKANLKNFKGLKLNRCFLTMYNVKR